MNALTPALPVLSAPPSMPGASPERDSGFADALQQARDPQPDAPDAPSADARPPARGEPAPAASAERPTPADKAVDRSVDTDPSSAGGATAATGSTAAAGPAALAGAAGLPSAAFLAGLAALAGRAGPGAPATRTAGDADPDGLVEAATGADGDGPSDDLGAAGVDALLPPWLEVALERPLRHDVATAGPRGAVDAAARGIERGAAPRATLATLAAHGAAAQSGPPTGPGGPDPASAAASPAVLALQDGAEALRRIPAAEVGTTAAAGTAASAAPLAAAAPRAEAALAVESAERTIAAPLHGPDFAPALGAQLRLLVRDGVTEARLHLNPAEMGPMTVQIQIDGQTARVEMAAEHAATRHVLEQSMPVLAGALRDSGLTLTGGGVFEQARDPRQDAGQGSAPDGSRGDAAQGADGADGTAEPGLAPRRAALPQGMLDLYA